MPEIRDRSERDQSRRLGDRRPQTISACPMRQGHVDLVSTGRTTPAEQRTHGSFWPFGHCRFWRVHQNAVMTKTEEVFVEAARRIDAEAICAIYNEAIAERESTFEVELRSAADFQARIRDALFPMLVARQGNHVIGWASLASYSSRPCYAGIGECSVYVAAEARGRGVGTALANDLASAAEPKGFHKLIGKLFPENVASVRLVERCGFDTVGTHRRHGQLDGVWRDVVVVERLISAAHSPEP